MALVQYGALITKLRGTIGGQVIQGGNGGDIIKNVGKVDSKLTKADAGRSIKVKKNIAFVAGRWRLLTPANRLSYNTGAVNYPAKNKLGNTYTPSGFQVFMGLNINLYRVGIINPMLLPPVSLPIMLDFIVASSLPATLNLNWTGPLPPDCIIKVEATQPLNQSSVPKNSFFKDISLLTGAEVSPQDISGDYYDVFGEYPAGANIWFRYTIISTITGQMGVPFITATPTI